MNDCIESRLKASKHQIITRVFPYFGANIASFNTQLLCIYSLEVLNDKVLLAYKAKDLYACKDYSILLTDYTYHASESKWYKFPIGSTKQKQKLSQDMAALVNHSYLPYLNNHLELIFYSLARAYKSEDMLLELEKLVKHHKNHVIDCLINDILSI